MKKDVILKLHSDFESMVRTETETGTEFWLARDLQNALGYPRWENFVKVINKAKTACLNSGYEIEDHFLDITKMIELGKGAVREIDDVGLFPLCMLSDCPKW